MKPSTIELIVTNLQNWFDDLPLEYQNMPQDECRAMQEQESIGWRWLFDSQLTKQWALLQDNHLHHIKLCTSSLNGKMWVSHIVKLI
eukprot:7498572-Ditylum_brightwellii.AAC.1